MKGRRGLVACLLFGSGTCALAYQIVWLRMMRLIFGASTGASAAVLAIFMGGLGVGGALLGPRADRHRRPLALYAQLELLIAVSAALTPALAWVARSAYVAVGGSVVLGTTGATLARLFLATLVLLVPTVLMGGTLPAASKAVQSDTDVSRRDMAVLYGVNTMGAVTGALLGNFVLLENFGAQRTLWAACGLNLVIALSAYGLAFLFPTNPVLAPTPVAEPVPPRKRARHTGQPAVTASKPARTLVPADSAHGAPDWYVFFAAAVVGCAFFLMELVWYRMLAPLLGGSSYTFGLILAVALLGIGLGGVAYALAGGERPATLRAFAITCALEAACIALPYALGDRVAFLTQALRKLQAFGFWGLALGWTEVIALLVLPAAFISGVQFPLLVALLGRGGEKVGRDVGLAYAWNTAGSIVGSLVGGFGLMAALSAPGVWCLVVGLLVALSFATMLMSFLREGRVAGLVPAAAIAIAALFMLRAGGPTAAWRHSGIGAGRSDLASGTMNTVRQWANGHRHSVQWERDGIESAVATDTSNAIAFMVNGKSDGNAIADGSTQVMGGLIGAILHPKPTNALVIGLGTGSTAGWLGAVPSIERVDVAELEPAIVEVARRCAPVNRDVLNNPKVHMFFGDGRELLQTTRTRYDIIFSEPSNPYRAGVASLFTREFYRSAANRLADGGIFLQWVQAYEVDSQTIRMIYATLASVFAAVETYETQRGDLILVASQQPIVYDVAALRQRVTAEPFRAALASVWRTTRLEGFLARFVADASIAQAIAALEGDRLNTDDMTVIEYSFARNVGRGGLFSDDELWNLARARKADRPAMVNGTVDWDTVLEERTSEYVANEEVPPPTPDTVSQDLLRRMLALAQYLDDKLQGALDAWRSQSAEPTTHAEFAMLAEALAENADEAALAYIEHLRVIESAEADAVLARLRLRQGRLDEAAAALEATFHRYRSAPWALATLMRNAIALAEQLVDTDAAYAERMYRSLSTPFVVNGQDDRRLFAAARITSHASDPGLCVEAFTQFEPYVPWDAGFLTLRRNCYQKAGHPNAVRAQADVDLYNSEIAKPLAADVGL